MPPHPKGFLNQARLETEFCDYIVQLRQREVELNGMSAAIETNITGVHQIDVQGPQPPQNALKPEGPCYGCGHPGHGIKTCTKTAR